MNRLYVAIIMFFVLVALAAAVYFLLPILPSLFNGNDVNQQNISQEVIRDLGQPLTKEEQKEVLNDLLPENIIDTPEEFDEQIDLLNQLQQTDPQNSDLEILNQLQKEVSVEEQLRQLEALQN